MRVKLRWRRKSATPDGKRKPVVRWVALLITVIAAAAGGSALGTFLEFDLPDIRALEDYRPPQMTRVLDREGREVDSFAEQRRILISHQQIPALFRNALLATEDTNFERHTGIDMKALLRAVWRDLTSLTMAEGGSTLTQQLARNLFLHPEKTWRRKAQEAVLALEVERQYTKEEILAFYCNQIYMGHGRYGIEAASRFYFDKPVRDLSLPETAMLVGLIQRPEALSPIRRPERARDRRDLVLRRMAEVGFITAEQAAAARAEPVVVATRRSSRNDAPYFVEDVRRWLQQRFGNDALYQTGLDVSTTLDLRLQHMATKAVDAGLRELDKRQGWRGVARRVPDGENPTTWSPESWSTPPAIGEVVDGVVTFIGAGKAQIRAGEWRGALGREQTGWTGRKEMDRLFRVGDIVRVRLGPLAADGSVALALEQEPQVEVALVAIEPATGAVRALVGGFDFGRSEFNRATQALRQTGSAFKPFVFAAALAAGWTAADTILDEPTVFVDPAMPEPYEPENYSRKYNGRITLRTALEESLNIPTVKLMEAIGADGVIDTARRLGIRAEFRPYPSLALGAFEVRLIDLTAAYGALANQGVLVEPHLIDRVVDRSGNVVESVDPQIRDAVPPEIAYVMNQLLEGVISDGTGRAAADLDLNIAGKTGTTDEFTDAWFVGYSPDLVVGVWVGFDERRSLGSRETGARAALPIWISFMEQVRPLLEAKEFPRPSGVSIVHVDRQTGLRASHALGCAPSIAEAFLRGSEPAVACTAEEHVKLRFPYPLHRYPLNERGEWVIPEDELRQLVDWLPDLSLGDGGRRLSLRSTPQVSLPVAQMPPDPGGGVGWDTVSRGTDGFPARVVSVGTRADRRGRR